jgi:hypothetical protein
MDRCKDSIGNPSDDWIVLLAQLFALDQMIPKYHQLEITSTMKTHCPRENIQQIRMDTVSRPRYTLESLIV